jgi:hypothetical protein
VTTAAAAVYLDPPAALERNDAISMNNVEAPPGWEPTGLRHWAIGHPVRSHYIIPVFSRQSAFLTSLELSVGLQTRSALKLESTPGGNLHLKPSSQEGAMSLTSHTSSYV